MVENKAMITSKDILDARRNILPTRTKLEKLASQLVDQRKIRRDVAHTEVLIALAEKRFEDALPMIVLYGMNVPPDDLKKVADAYLRNRFHVNSEYLTFIRDAYESMGLENEARDLHGAIVDAVEQENYEKESRVGPA